MNYLYVIHIPVIKGDGKYWMPQLAAIDLLAHRRLLPSSVRLVLAAPVVKKPEGPLLPLDDIEVVPLRYENSFGKGLCALLPNCVALWREISHADFIHTGCGGFPFFFAIPFLAHLIAFFQHKPRLFVMDCDLVGKLESDQIAHAGGLEKAIWQAYAGISWRLFKFCLKTAKATFLLGRGVKERYGPYANNSLEIYQPIIGAEDVISEEELCEKLESIRAGQPLKAIFIGRLAHEKGVDIFLQALEILKKRGITFQAKIIGDGEERSKLEELAKKSKLDIIFSGQVSWGEAVFVKLRESHIFVIPHLTEEMTRSAIEPLASGCALACSNTVALRQLLADSKAGISFKKGDAEGLADVMAEMNAARSNLVRMIEEGTAFFRENHRDAHIQRRLDFLSRTFSHLNWR